MGIFSVVFFENSVLQFFFRAYLWHTVTVFTVIVFLVIAIRPPSPSPSSLLVLLCVPNWFLSPLVLAPLLLTIQPVILPSPICINVSVRCALAAPNSINLSSRSPSETALL
jgi:hypothetical protein